MVMRSVFGLWQELWAYTPDFRPREMDFPFRSSAHPLPLFAH
jgi:hypothetical protein